MSVEDRWFRAIDRPDGLKDKVKTDRHGVGKRWLVRWRDQAGKPRKQSFTKKHDAEVHDAKVKSAKASGTFFDPSAGKVRLRDYADQWRKSQFRDPTTENQVALRFRLHVYPFLGDHPLSSIQPSTIRQWLAWLAEDGKSRTYQRTIFSNVSQVFSAAIDDEKIGKNPCNSPTIRKPVPDPKQIVPWPSNWVGGVRNALPDRYRVLVDLAAGCGLRQGEVFGLSPDDVDFLRGFVQVKRQVKVDADGRLHFAPPKGRKTRTVPLPRSVRWTLSAYLRDFPARSVTMAWDLPTGDPVTVRLVVTTRESGAVNRNTFNRHTWKPALGVAEIPSTRENGCHALRHYYASTLLHGGESIKAVSERLGHSDPGFTLRTYTHLMPDTEDKTRGIIDDAFLELGDPRSSAGAPDVPHAL